MPISILLVIRKNKIMNKLRKITIGIGIVSLITSVIHKLLINDIEIYKSFLYFAMIPFLIFLLFIIIHLFHGIFSNLFKKQFKQLFISMLISFGFLVMWIIIMTINKETFVFLT